MATEHKELFFHDHYECTCGFRTESEIAFERHSRKNKMQRDTLTPEWIESILNSEDNSGIEEKVFFLS